MALTNATVAVDDIELQQCKTLWEALVGGGKGGDRWDTPPLTHPHPAA